MTIMIMVIVLHVKTRKTSKKVKKITSWAAIIHPIGAELNAPRNKGQCFVREEWHICDVIWTGKIKGGGSNRFCMLFSFEKKGSGGTLRSV
jgi:hypothetical protein